MMKHTVTLGGWKLNVETHRNQHIETDDEQVHRWM